MLAHRRRAERFAELNAEVERAEEENRTAMERLNEAGQKVQVGTQEVARLREQIRNLNNEIMAHKKRSGQNALETDAKRLMLQKKLNGLQNERADWTKRIEQAGSIRKEIEDKRKGLQATRSKVVG